MEALISFLLTLAIFSYLLGDIPLVRSIYRTAVYLFVGIAAAFTTIATVEGVLLPLGSQISNVADGVIFITALIMGLLLLLKPVRQLAWLTNSVFAVVIAVGAAVALVGTISGTLLPLTFNTTNSVNDNLAEGIIIFIGVASSLIYFQYQARRKPDGTTERGRISRTVGTVGKGFIVATLGALYATAILTSLTIFTERIGILTTFGG